VRFACLCQSTADTGPHSVKEKVLPLTAEKGGVNRAINGTIRYSLNARERG